MMAVALQKRYKYNENENENEGMQNKTKLLHQQYNGKTAGNSRNQGEKQPLRPDKNREVPNDTTNERSPGVRRGLNLRTGVSNKNDGTSNFPSPILATLLRPKPSLDAHRTTSTTFEQVSRGENES
jgi:hypothetical protein